MKGRPRLGSGWSLFCFSLWRRCSWGWWGNYSMGGGKGQGGNGECKVEPFGSSVLLYGGRM